MDTLTIWFRDGKTAHFEKVEDCDIGEIELFGEKAVITFTYFRTSTPAKRKAVFLLDNIAGFALSTE